ncbi:MAG: hypothetical protein UT66_C0024G0004 [candidate division CPR2 bacterium GW2011_GWC1_39_9]|uniref:Antitoxin n=1 Tax=candidate division CPR2 bacterium GW2011_GWC2_39_10 TaxID=1618345 RepID=A0A0G0LRR5_UNCC2|nr:MAG: hypothetical protein UT18_C0016G0028 [candidate division CPR2 bacterium GW2011_GWC2_39_10]KKR34420.1 MAG: hypothetical protein UT66_C0024G0004 [candidate division CPR2 bacterium GW2011_GWC1_39_9]
MKNFVNINELQNETPKIIQGLNDGEDFVLLRYSKPVGVLVSYETYNKLICCEDVHVEECKSCIKDFKKELHK